MRPSLLVLLLSCTLSLTPRESAAQGVGGSQLEDALNVMYSACLFGENNPFSQAVLLSRAALAPGFSGFVENNIASIPLTPPTLEASYVEGRIVTSVTGFTPIFSESSATVGGGRFLAGSNLSYFSLTKLRGQELDDLSFTFAQNGGGSDVIRVTMPLGLDATVLSLFGTYGITDRFDVGIALPFVRLGFDRRATTFEVIGNQTGCRYGAGCQPGQTAGSPIVDYTFAGGVAIDIGADENVEVAESDNPTVPTAEYLLGTVAVRAKYRFPTAITNGRLAAVLDLRLPVGRSDEGVLGGGNFSSRLTFVGEYESGVGFRPYVNLGSQFWNGPAPNSIIFGGGFAQQVAQQLFFSFDLLGDFALEDDPFLALIDDEVPDDLGDFASEVEQAEQVLLESAIPFADREHALDAGLGLQYAPLPNVHVYGSVLFALLSRGLQSSVAPTVGAAVAF